MLTAIDYVALDPALNPISIYWLGINGVVARAIDDATPYPTAVEVRTVLENV
jgi:hypothetical protein